MRSIAILVGSLALIVADPASAVDYVWSELSLQFTNLGRAEASSTSLGVATVNTSSSASSHLSSITLPGQSLSSVVPVTDPFQAPITAVRFDLQQRPDLQGGGVIGNVSGAIGASGGLTPNTIPMTGGVTLCLGGQYNCQYLQLMLPLGATSAGNQVGAGVGGILTIGGTGTLRVSVLGAPYTVLTVSAPRRTENGGLDVVTARGFAHGPLSQTSSTAETSGVLQLVTATHITAVGVGSGQQDIGGSISKTLVHMVQVPEPGLPLLLCSGAGLVALLGWRRRRER
jgi:hypothetical protein